MEAEAVKKFLTKMEAEAEAMKIFFTKLKRKRKRHQDLPLPKHCFRRKKKDQQIKEKLKIVQAPNWVVFNRIFSNLIAENTPDFLLL